MRGALFFFISDMLTVVTLLLWVDRDKQAQTVSAILHENLILETVFEFLMWQDDAVSNRLLIRNFDTGACRD